MSDPYAFAAIEKKWQQYWQTHNTFQCDVHSKKDKYYVLDMFPYPSGHGLHVGHVKGYVGSDIIARFKKMQGFEVLHPMGWDSFGLPTERQAEKDGISPQQVTERNVKTFKGQLQRLGMGYDWSKELATSNPNYFKWTQWIFLKLYTQGLAYQADVSVNWCPALGTVLANEEVVDGEYVETGDPVEKRTMRQWMLKITHYADRLLADLDLVDWPASVKEMQRNWIGRKEGALVRFSVEAMDEVIEVFTTRPDTLFGATFCVLAPEHRLVEQLTTAPQRGAMQQYLQSVSKLSERDRLADKYAKTGVFTGTFAVNPVNGKKIQIWVADFVLAGHGSGAIFACPGHDTRDFEFASQYALDIIEVVASADHNLPYTGEGLHVNSEFLNGLDVDAAKSAMLTWLEQHGAGSRHVAYRLRDWLFSRQRYWGEPIPILYKDNGERVRVSVDALPILLPAKTELAAQSSVKSDTVSAPLGRAKEWQSVTDPQTGVKLSREINVMPQWAGSCWYYLRFLDPHNNQQAWDKELDKAWLPIDLYVGGVEHATLHLLYARFWHKFFYDLGLSHHPEPFQKLFNQGMVHARSFRDKRGKYFYPHQVEQRADKQWIIRATGEVAATKIEKMSKSKYNVVNPDAVTEKYGADSLRIYEVFMGPLEDVVVWQTDSISGCKRFLDRVWHIVNEVIANKPSENGSEKHQTLLKSLHKTIRKVSQDAQSIKFNTAISQLMQFCNDAYKLKSLDRPMAEALVKMLAPFAPHMCEQLWEKLGQTPSIFNAAWPVFDPKLCVDANTNIAVQVNGKLRAKIEVSVDSDELLVKTAALANENIRRHMHGTQVKKIIFVKNRLINFVCV